VVVSSDGTIYWTSSICTNADVDVEDALVALFSDANGRYILESEEHAGYKCAMIILFRLFKYDPVKKTNTMLVDKIHFANGLALSANEDFIVVSETMRCRLLRFAIFILESKGVNE
jgi:adipocyte plasma membrane-associated protein